MDKSKSDFIADLLSHKRINSSDKAKLLSLIAKEFKNDSSISEKILDEIYAIKEGIHSVNFIGKIAERSIGGESVIIEAIIKETGAVSESNATKVEKYLCKIEELLDRDKGYLYAYNKYQRFHAPQNTTKFLKLFKIDNDTGLKEIVHSPLSSHEYDFHEHLTKVFKLNHFQDFTKIEKNEWIHFSVFLAFLHLLKEFIIEGDITWVKNKTHPWEGSERYKSLAKNFKKTYRFENEDTEGTVLSKLFLEAFSTKQPKELDNVSLLDRFGKNPFEFLPTLDWFNASGSFYAHVTSIRNFFEAVFDDCLKYSNGVAEDGKFRLFIKRENFDNEETKWKYTLTFIDKNSQANKSPQEIFTSLKDRTKLLFSICDWFVEFSNKLDGKSYRIRMLELFAKKDSERIIEIEPPQGFTHKLIFYDFND